MAYEMEMSSVLQRLNLKLFAKKFDVEKITPDLVGKLPLDEFKKLGMQNCNNIMALRLECTKYRSEKPQKKDKLVWGSVLECYIDQNLTIIEICKIL